MKNTLFIVVTLSVLSIMGSAHASMLQVTYSGDIDFANDTGTLLGTTLISNSSTFAGKFTYDTETTPTSSDPTSASYLIEPGFTITIDGTYVFGVNNSGAFIENDAPTSPSGYMDEIAAGGSWLDGLVLPFSTSNVYIQDFGVAVFLKDWTGTALNSTSLPNTINLAAFRDKFISIDASYFSLDQQYSYNLNIAGTITSLDVAPVPEPTTMLLLGTGLIGVAGAARRKKKNQA